ncbi:MAG: DNA mismatch repair protein MutS [Oscillospiraceae bacterium]|nr:DNA mismatch repair protein MutS [Oscillospiraceae bacterium]
MAELTPMMRQYLDIKAQHPDCVLFFRLGDFYEMFADDARLASKELDLTLTTRDRGKEKSEQTPMCGVPYHSAESYIARLVQRGYKVAICEQMEDPALAKGLVKRDLTRIVTPGTVVESSMLDESRNNYFACVFGEGGRYGVSFCDVSTGAFYATSAEGAQAIDRVISELGRFMPAEVLRGGEAAQNEALTQALQERLSCCSDLGAQELFDPAVTEETVTKQFDKSLAALGLQEHSEVWRSAGALLATLRELQKVSLTHVRNLEFYVEGRFLELDLTARRNLELTETLHGDKRGSLLWVLDKTRTAMGSRMLRSWLEKPLLSPKKIAQRLAAVEELTGLTVERDNLRELLKQVSDLERVMARIVTGAANGRDLIALRNGCEPLGALKAAFSGLNAPLFGILQEEIDDLQDCFDLVSAAIVDEPPFTVREGGILRDGYSDELDKLRDIVSGGKGTLARIEAEEKEKTGIKNLRVGYTRVFGYYIEVAKGQVSLVPEHYIRRQTLTTGERYITPELKELESTILTAKDRITALEYELFSTVRDYLAAQSARVQRTARAVACLDVIANFAELAVKHNYCKPEVDLSGEIIIRDGRHPVVEQMLKDSLFVPNDTLLDCGNNRTAIITGPNMAGKSTYMRQVALIVLMAQIGCFVPAKSARIGVVDRIFTRIGASDDLSMGKSTFMVEMTEVADILTHATARSLLILDEIGRGTSTFDGMAIARAVLEYAADKKRLGAKTLFATHYHELTDIEREIEGVRNYNIAVKKRGSDIVFLRKIVPGAADDSYGVEVAKLAGLPDKVISRARDLLKALESGAPVRTVTVAADDQISITSMENDALRKKLESLAVETMTPIEAMNALYELKKMV